MNTTAKIIIAILGILLLVSIAFNIFGSQRFSEPMTPLYNGAIDSVRVVDKSTVLYIPNPKVDGLSDTTIITLAKRK